MSRSNKDVAVLVCQDVWGKGNVALVDELYAENYVNLNPAPGLPATREGVKHEVQLYQQAFPDVAITVDDVVANDDKVVVRYTVRGTHTGEMMGIPPTNNSAEISGISMVRVENGQVVEEFGLTDMMTLFQQLGLAPAMS